MSELESSKGQGPPAEASAIAEAVAIFGSQTELARAAGVSVQAVSFWVRGDRGISPQSAIKVEAATGGRVSRQRLLPSIFGREPASPSTATA